MLGDDAAVAVDGHSVEGGGDVDEPADDLRVERVLDGVDADVVVPPEPDPVVQFDRRCHRRQRDHRRMVGLQQVDRAALSRPDGPRVRADEPVYQLLVEVRG